MGKLDRVRGAIERAHSDLYDNEYTAEFYTHSGGSYNPDTGQIEGDTRSKIGSTTVELVPPAMDTTVETDGTSMSWDTSIRFPDSVSFLSSLTPLGEDSEKPTEVEVSNPADSSLTVYELHGYSIERGSGMVMCRLVEQ